MYVLVKGFREQSITITLLTYHEMCHVSPNYGKTGSLKGAFRDMLAKPNLQTCTKRIAGFNKFILTTFLDFF